MRASIGWSVPRSLLILAFVSMVAAGARADPCAPPGAWVDPATGARLAARDVLDRAAASRVVLLGETHDNADHHRWQLHTVAALHALAGGVVLGFEMFPRRVQPALDRWVAGELTEREFLAEADWDAVWGVDAALYTPLFHFARVHRTPMRALNVERDVVERVREEGLDSVPAAAREGIGDPAPAAPGYVAWLIEVYREHRARAGDDAAAEIDADDPGFRRFVEAQLTWDRAMAEALAAAAAGPDAPPVVGVIGSGHLRHGYGVPHQLAALGVEAVTVLLPWDQSAACDDLAGGLADAVFGLAAPAAEPAGPRLGVLIRKDEGGVRVAHVLADSVAARAGLVADDVIVEAAGVAVEDTGDLIAVVRRQAPGTWLPLSVMRGEVALELVAEFPPPP